MRSSVLRKMQNNDLEQVLSWRNSPSVRCNMFNQGVISLEGHKNWFMRLSSEPERHHLLILEHAGVAQAYLSFEVSKYNFVSWGFYKAPDAQRGIGYDLGVKGLHYAFTKIKAHKVVGEVLQYNEGSIALHTKLGFKQEGILREQYQHADSYFNVISYGLLADEWDKMRAVNG